MKPDLATRLENLLGYSYPIELFMMVVRNNDLISRVIMLGHLKYYKYLDSKHKHTWEEWTEFLIWLMEDGRVSVKRIKTILEGK